VRAPRPSAPSVSESVELGYLSGSPTSGTLSSSFSAANAELFVDMEQGGRSLVHAERIAYVAFHRGASEQRPSLGDGATQRLRISAGGSDFDVHVRRDSTKSTLGFRAVPVDDSSPFREIFFYAHGVMDMVAVVERGERHPSHAGARGRTAGLAAS